VPEGKEDIYNDILLLPFTSILLFRYKYLPNISRTVTVTNFESGVVNSICTKPSVGLGYIFPAKGLFSSTSVKEGDGATLASLQPLEVVAWVLVT